MFGWQIVFSTQDRASLFPDEATLRRGVQAIGRSLGAKAPLFCLVDDHLHVVVDGEDRAAAGRMAHALALALRPVVAAPTLPAHLEPVTNRQHMLRLVSYVLSQTVHHDLGTHPALWSGSCFLDLMGARVVPGVQPPLFDVLPRLKPGALLEAVGLPASKVQPASLQLIRRLGGFRLAEAASASLAVDPALAGRQAPVVEARIAALRLARDAQIAPGELIEPLRTTARSARRLQSKPIDERILLAVRTRLAIEEMVTAGALLGAAWR